MANMYHETAWFAGPPGQMKALREVLTIEDAPDTEFVEVNINGEMLVRGWDVSSTETPVSLKLEAEMRWDPLACCFYRISQAVRGLFMASFSSCIHDNRYLLLAGFDRLRHFRAEPPMYTNAWEEVPGISDEDGKLLRIAWEGFEAAFEAAKQSFARGNKTPRRALRILRDAGDQYEAFGPPPDSGHAEFMAALAAKFAPDG